MNKWGTNSKRHWKTLCPDLQLLSDTVLQIHDCSLIDGHRGEFRQNKYYEDGTSSVKWPNSMHNKLPSQAMDLAPYLPGVNPYDHEHVLQFSGIVLCAATMLYDQGLMSKRTIWGGTWKEKIGVPFAFDENRFYDGIHFQLV